MEAGSGPDKLPQAVGQRRGCQGLLCRGLSGRRVWAVMGRNQCLEAVSRGRRATGPDSSVCLPHPPLGQRNSSCPQTRPEL